MTSLQQRLHRLYAFFNVRDIEAVLAEMKPNVQWANGMEGGYVYGRDKVRQYWTAQFAQVQPQLQILRFHIDAQNRVTLAVHQTVRDLEGNLLLEQELGHRFTFENDLVALFEIVESPAEKSNS